MKNLIFLLDDCIIKSSNPRERRKTVKFDVYCGNGNYVETIEVESEEDLADAAEEACREWVCENMYWEPAEEEE